MSRIRLVSMLLLPLVCVVVRSAKQFRLQCTLESLQWRQWRLTTWHTGRNQLNKFIFKSNLSAIQTEFVNISAISTCESDLNLTVHIRSPIPKEGGRNNLPLIFDADPNGPNRTLLTNQVVRNSQTFTMHYMYKQWVALHRHQFYSLQSTNVPPNTCSTTLLTKPVTVTCIYDSRTMSPFDKGGKPGFSLATSVLSASEISWQLRYINSHLPLPLQSCMATVTKPFRNRSHLHNYMQL